MGSLRVWSKREIRLRLGGLNNVRRHMAFMGASPYGSEEVRRLFHEQVPELVSGIVEIRGIAREAGRCCMITVSSQDPGVDPVGSCVGPRGVRVKTVLRGLSGEQIVIIPWSESASELIRSALSPVVAVVQSIALDEAGRKATVRVGRRGGDRSLVDAGRLRLASRLVGWELQVVFI